MGRGHSHALHHHGHSVVHRLAPETKLVAAFGFVLAVAVTPREAFWAYGVHATLLLSVMLLAKVPARFVIARAAVVTPFVMFALLLPFIADGDRTTVLGVSVAVEGLWGAWQVLARASLGVVTSVLLAATTELPDLLAGMRRLRVPPVLTQIAAFMIRYLEVVAGELGRMRTAMTARGYDPRWLWQAKPVAQSAGALFIRSYERGERVHEAMLARGYTGAMPDLRGTPATAVDWVRGAALPVAAATAATTALLLG